MISNYGYKIEVIENFIRISEKHHLMQVVSLINDLKYILPSYEYISKNKFHFYSNTPITTIERVTKITKLGLPLAGER